MLNTAKTEVSNCPDVKTAVNPVNFSEGRHYMPLKTTKPVQVLFPATENNSLMYK
jgi:hypothetical protein